MLNSSVTVLDQFWISSGSVLGPGSAFRFLSLDLKSLEQLFGEIKMWVHRISVKGGFLFDVYVNDASTRVTRMGTIYLYNIGWHPSCNPFVSSDDDAILRKRGFLLFDEDKWNSHCLQPGS